MSNKHNKGEDSRQEELQSQITAKYRRTQLLVFLGNWASDMETMYSLEENNQLIETLWECFLISNYGDDGDSRRQVYLFIQKLEQLFTGLEGRSHEDFREVDKWILKQTS